MRRGTRGSEVVVRRRHGAGDTVLRALGIISLPFVLLGLAVYSVTRSLEGCETGLDLGPGDLGFRPGPRGTVVADPGPCRPMPGRELVLRGPARQVLWRAVAPAGARPLEPFTVGRAPSGYRDAAPLDFPLLPGVSYTVEVHVLGSGDRAGGTTLPPDMALAFGAEGEFRPGDLAPGRVWFAGRSLTPEEFALRACPTGTTTATTS